MSTLSDVLFSFFFSVLQFSDPCPYLDVSAGVDFVNSISGGSAGFPVQVVTLNKHCVVTEASHPHISLAFTLKLNPFANVKPGRGERRAGNKGNRERMGVIKAPCGILFTFNDSRVIDITVIIEALWLFPYFPLRKHISNKVLTIAPSTEGNWVTHLALSIASVRCTLLSWPKQNRSPPEGSTYPSTVTMGQVEGTLNVSPTWTSISK